MALLRVVSGDATILAKDWVLLPRKGLVAWPCDGFLRREPLVIDRGEDAGFMRPARIRSAGEARPSHQMILPCTLQVSDPSSKPESCVCAPYLSYIF